MQNVQEYQKNVDCIEVMRMVIWLFEPAVISSSHLTMRTFAHSTCFIVMNILNQYEKADVFIYLGCVYPGERASMVKASGQNS